MERTTLKLIDFWAGEALEARPGPKWRSETFQIYADKIFQAWKKSSYWMKVEVLPQDFCKLQPSKLFKNVQEPFCQVWKLFSAEIWKMSECHFRANVMLRQSHLRASMASPAQKSMGLRVILSKNFSRATFLLSGSHLVNIYLSYLPMKQIWWKNEVCICFSRNLIKFQLNQKIDKKQWKKKQLSEWMEWVEILWGFKKFYF